MYLQKLKEVKEVVEKKKKTRNQTQTQEETPEQWNIIQTKS